MVTLQAQPYALTSEVPGRTSAYRIAEVRPQVNGIIQKRLFTEGSEVKAGQQLYQIDPATYEAAYKSAQATLLSAKSLADRYKLLVNDKAVSQQAYDEARAASLQADAALEQARIDLRYTRVMAPISGRIGRSAVTEGALVSNGQASAMATIQQLRPDLRRRHPVEQGTAAPAPRPGRGTFAEGQRQRRQGRAEAGGRQPLRA